MNMIRNWLTHLFAHNLVTLLRRLEMEVERLEKAAEAFDAESDYHAAVARKHSAKQAIARTNANRAAILANKVRDLLED